MHAPLPRKPWKSRSLWQSAVGAAAVAAAAAPALADGTVTVTISGKTATIEGDGSANGVILGQMGNTIFVQPTSSTTISGATTIDTATVENVVIRLGGGNDYVEGVISLTGSLLFDLGPADDTIRFQSSSVDDLVILAGDGSDTCSFSQSVVKGDATFLGGTGGDALVLNGNQISGNLKVDARQGDEDALLSLSSMTVTGKTSVATGAPGRSVVSSVQGTVFVGPFKFRGGDARDDLLAGDASFESGCDVKAGGGDDRVIIDNVFLDGRAKVSGDDADDVLIVSTTQNRGAPTTRPSLTLSGGDGNDQIFLGNENVRTFLGTVVVDAGDGSDGYALNGVDAKKLTCKGGAGDDTDRVQSVSAEQATFDGGSGTDVLAGRTDGGNEIPKVKVKKYESETSLPI